MWGEKTCEVLPVPTESVLPSTESAPPPKRSCCSDSAFAPGTKLRLLGPPRPSSTLLPPRRTTSSPRLEVVVGGRFFAISVAVAWLFDG